MLPSLAFAATLTGSGWGESAVNTSYTEGGSINSYRSWFNGTYYVCHKNADHTWSVTTDSLCLSGVGDGPIYYSDDVVDTPDLVTNWIDNGGGTPLGEFELAASPSGGGFDLSIAVVASSAAAVSDWFIGPSGIAYLLIIFGAFVGLGVGIYLFGKLVGRRP